MDDPAHIIAGLEPLGGPTAQLRMIYTGTWDEPVYLAATWTTPEAELCVIHPGPEARELLAKVVFEGQTPRPSPSRRALRGTAELTELDAFMRDRIWSLASGELRGTDGHWITLQAHAPGRAPHTARDWCPRPGEPIHTIASLLVTAALPIDPGLDELAWVRNLLGATP